MIEKGSSYQHQFQFSQAEVELFAQVSGDHNPVHLDAEFAAKSPFKRPIMHGFLSGSVLSKVFGTLFPGSGTIYLKQSLEFMRPMYVDTAYEAQFKVISVDREKHRAKVETLIIGLDNQKVCLRGEAEVMHPEAI